MIPTLKVRAFSSPIRFGKKRGNFKIGIIFVFALVLKTFDASQPEFNVNNL